MRLRRCSVPDVGLLQTRVRKWAAATTDLLLPPGCASCGRFLPSADRQPVLCPSCRANLLAERMEHACRFCGAEQVVAGDGSNRCVGCRTRKWMFERVVSLGRYRGEIRNTVLRMKQFHEYALTAAVGALLAEQLVETLQQRWWDVIVPVPKYWLKRWWQGASAAEVMAEVVAVELRSPLAVRALRWRRRTRKQSLLPLAQRRRNLAGALGARPLSVLHGANVLLLDDIMTTGATAQEASRALRKRGARSVTVGVVGRALVDRLRTGRSSDVR